MSSQLDLVTVIDHPIVSRDMTIVRNKKTNTADFRAAIARIATILAFYSLKEIPLKKITIDTPVQATDGYDIDMDIVIVPILRAGLSLVSAIIDFVPDAKVGHLGMYRDEKTHKPVDYYSNMPAGLESSLVLVVDPMLATGGSAEDAISFVKEHGATNIRFISLISAPEGLNRITSKFPDVPVITAAIDDHLNDDAFIIPGLGDAGDRYFGT
jgi:uracil phosphoribosyltransferase